MTRSLHRGPDAERGAVAVFVALIAVILFAATAFAIDAGGLWATRRNMVSASDAGALSAAGSSAIGNSTAVATDKCVATATNADNAADTATCTTESISASKGVFTATANKTYNFSFAGVMGLSNKVVASTTSARWGIPKGARGLRPYGLCLNSSDLAPWLNLPVGPTTTFTTRVYYAKTSQTTPCSAGNNPGNWGLVDLDSNPSSITDFNPGCVNSNGTNDTVDWTTGGYDGTVSVGDYKCSKPGTALSGSVANALDTLKDKEFALPIFDVAQGQGSNWIMHIVAFAVVELVKEPTTGCYYKLNGSQCTYPGDTNGDTWLNLKFKAGVIDGPCCGAFSSTSDFKSRVVEICDVDKNSGTVADRCGT